jgi:hypothetical protein
MERMFNANQRKLEDLKGTIQELKGRAQVMEERMDEVERSLKQNQKVSKKKKNRRTAAEIAKIFKVSLWNYNKGLFLSYSVPTRAVNDNTDQRCP